MSCGTDHGLSRDLLAAEYGKPAPAEPGAALRLLGLRHQVHPRDVRAHVYRDQPAADAWAAANRDLHGYPFLGTAPCAGGITGVIDLRPSLRAHGVTPTDPALPDTWLPAPAAVFG